MATVAFEIHSKKNSASVYVRFSVARGKIFKRKTGHTIDPNFWSKKGLPSGRNAFALNLKQDLLALGTHIEKAFSVDNSKGVLIDGNWLEGIVENYYSRVKKDDLLYFVNYGEKYIKGLPFKAKDDGSVGVEDSTVGKYVTIVNKIRAFEKFHNTKILLTDIDLNFRSAFMEFLYEEQGLSDGTVGRALKFVKTIALDAELNGFGVSKQLRAFKGFTSDVPIVSLSEEEILTLWKATLSTDKLVYARDWLIISCRTAQRASDLLRMNKSMFTEINGKFLLQLKQKKTKKPVNLAIHPQVQEILKKYDGNFPPGFGKTSTSANAIYNRHLKDVCREAGLDALTEGNLRNPETKVYEKGNYAKWRLITSHTGRRTFATLGYGKISTPLLMNMTGHTSEKTFLKYVGRESSDMALQLHDIWNDAK